MTPVPTVVTLGLLSCFGFAAYEILPPVQGPGDIPWKDLAGGSAAVLMFSAIIVFLRFLAAERMARDNMLSEERKARMDERAADRALTDSIAEKHAATLQQLGETQMMLMKELVHGALKDR